MLDTVFLYGREPLLIHRIPIGLSEYVKSCYIFKYLGKTSLHWASQSGHTSVVQLLLDRGSLIDKKDNLGMFILSIYPLFNCPYIPFNFINFYSFFLFFNLFIYPTSLYLLVLCRILFWPDTRYLADF